MKTKSRLIRQSIIALICLLLLIGVGHPEDVKSKSLRLIAVMLLSMAALGGAHIVFAPARRKSSSNEKEILSCPADRGELTEAKEQLAIVFGVLTAMAFPGLLFYIDQQTGALSGHPAIVAVVITLLTMTEHSYAWRALGLKGLGKGFSAVVASLTIFFAFLPLFGTELYPSASQLVAELLVMIYLPLCWSSNFRSRKGWL